MYWIIWTRQGFCSRAVAVHCLHCFQFKHAGKQRKCVFCECTCLWRCTVMFMIWASKTSCVMRLSGCTATTLCATICSFSLCCGGVRVKDFVSGNRRDNRLPFENTLRICSLSKSLPTARQRFELNAINDVLKCSQWQMPSQWCSLSENLSGSCLAKKNMTVDRRSLGNLKGHDGAGRKVRGWPVTWHHSSWIYKFYWRLIPCCQDIFIRAGSDHQTQNAVRAMQLAYLIKQQFKSDVIL